MPGFEEIGINPKYRVQVNNPLNPDKSMPQEVSSRQQPQQLPVTDDIRTSHGRLLEFVRILAFNINPPYEPQDIINQMVELAKRVYSEEVRFR